MLTLKKLLSNTEDLQGSGFNATNTFSIRKVSPIPFKEQLAIQAEFRALTDKKAERYLTTIVFHKVEYSLTKSSRATTPVAILPDKNMYLVPPSYSRSPVKISCTCRRYAYAFSYFNGINGVNNTPITYPPEFKNVLPKGIVNPIKQPGVCKHVNALQDRLYAQRVLRI